MELKDARAWEEGLAANSDPYGGATYEYAEKWANLMEADIGGGKLLSDIAKRTSHDADKDIGITGFMYGCVVQILGEVWIHGEELRRWHNDQYGESGQRANESGGTINPAILTIGVPKR